MPKSYKFQNEKKKFFFFKFRDAYIGGKNKNKEVSIRKARLGVSQWGRRNAGLEGAFGEVSRGLMEFCLLTCWVLQCSLYNTH